MSKRSVEGNSIDNKRPKLELYTRDKDTAQNQQFLTEIITSNGELIYTSWVIFHGLDYFDTLVRVDKLSPEKTRQIKFNLTTPQAEIYLDLLIKYRLHEVDLESIRYFFRILDLTTLFAVYDQLDYNRIVPLLEICVDEIRYRPYNLELYGLNSARKVISSQDMVRKVISAIIDFGGRDIELPGEDEIDFWEILVRSLNEYNVVMGWKLFRNLNRDQLKKYLLEYKPKIVTWNDLYILFKKYERDEGLEIYIKHVVVKFVEENKRSF